MPTVYRGLPPRRTGGTVADTSLGASGQWAMWCIIPLAVLDMALILTAVLAMVDKWLA